MISLSTRDQVKVCDERCVHDPAWWWAEASNLRASSDAVVRFNLAHGCVSCRVLLEHDPWVTMCLL